jgi:GT2 family glycosyltransferase
MSAITIISATRHPEAAFWRETHLGKSLSSFTAYRLTTRIAFENTEGLAACYNRAIARCAESDIMVFMHDDVMFADFYWIDHLLAALSRFDIVGVAGTTRRAPGQDRWFWAEHPAYKEDGTLLSGYIGNGDGLPCKVSAFGPVGRACVLLDGVFLAARKSTFAKGGLAFDERFAFHFYDLDLCRQATARGLKLGTAAISLVHQSEGAYTSEAWTTARQSYFEKWRD